MKTSILLLFLSILNLFDGLMTFFGIHFDLINELNPFMNYIIQVDLLLFLSLKAILSIFLFILAIFFRHRQASIFVKGLLIISLLLYSSVTIVHILWLILLI
ncbi:hypothetical protein CHH80_01760 [Bacillus sp. 7504-2]|nr:hypothetical protein CHH80_01760 [Bacillus sp. 7504-2]